MRVLRGPAKGTLHYVTITGGAEGGKVAWELGASRGLEVSVGFRLRLLR